MPAQPPRRVRSALSTTPRTAVRDDGRLWCYVGGGPIIEEAGRAFVRMFPAGALGIDAVLDEIWIWEPQMADEQYAHLGVKVSVEWFRR